MKEKLEEFTKLKHLDFEKINLKFLKEFEHYLTKAGLKTNARGVHFRNIRAIFNKAIDEYDLDFYGMAEIEETILKKLKVMPKTKYTD